MDNTKHETLNYLNNFCENLENNKQIYYPTELNIKENNEYIETYYYENINNKPIPIIINNKHISIAKIIMLLNIFICYIFIVFLCIEFILDNDLISKYLHILDNIIKYFIDNFIIPYIDNIIISAMSILFKFKGI